MSLVFKSKRETLHIQNSLKNPNVAGAITVFDGKIGSIKGIQFAGIFSEPRDAVLLEVRNNYYKRFPFAMAYNGALWQIELQTVKMTNNSKVFAEKLFWNLETGKHEI